MLNIEALEGTTYISFLAFSKFVSDFNLNETIDLEIKEVEISYIDKIATFTFKNGVEICVMQTIINNMITLDYYSSDEKFFDKGTIIYYIADLYFHIDNFVLSSILFISYELLINNDSRVVNTKIIQKTECHFYYNTDFFVVDMNNVDLELDYATDKVTRHLKYKTFNFKRNIEVSIFRELGSEKQELLINLNCKDYNKSDFLLEPDSFSKDIIGFFAGDKLFDYENAGMYLDNSNFAFTTDIIRISDNVKARITINQIKIDKIDYSRQYYLDSDFKFNIIDINIYLFDNFKDKEIVNIYTDKFEVEWTNKNNYTATFKDSQHNYFDYIDILDLIKQNIFNFCF